jgi:nitronate monooxygenase
MEAKRGDGHGLHQLHGKAHHERAEGDAARAPHAALDAGIDGITLAAGLHLGSFGLIEEHPRFRDAKLGIIVSSLRALQLFLRKSARTNRLPDYVVVEGPLAGGHLGFGMDWEVRPAPPSSPRSSAWLKAEQLDIP